MKKRTVIGAILNFSLAAFAAAEGDHADDHILETEHEPHFEVQPFFVEPAERHNVFVLNYDFHTGDHGDEHETEVEIELALTEKFGLTLEQRYSFLEEDDIDGLADLAVVPRMFLIQQEDFFLTANLEIEIPTGHSDLTSDEVALAPSVSARWNLNGNWVLHAQFGVETTLESNETALFGSAAIIHPLSADGRLNILLETQLELGLSDEISGDLHATGLIGLSHSWSEQFAVRAGYHFPMSSPREFDTAFIVGIVRFF